LGFPLGYLDQTNTMQVFDFKLEDHPFVPIYMFVDRKGTIRFQPDKPLPATLVRRIVKERIAANEMKADRKRK